MAICGPPITSRQISAERTGLRCVQRLLTPLFACMAVALLSGCGAASYQIGVALPVDQLQKLIVGSSTTTDVRQTLGEPNGHGAVGLPVDPTQDLWVYRQEYVGVMLGKVRESFLFVFVDRQSGVFNGYMWFRYGEIITPYG